ncbi:Protein of unknown function [Bacillus cytotoxicus]|nr:Protein of unknown function [Bacillus cytotoxicus]
MELDVAL